MENISRPHSNQLNEVLGKKFSVLDSGFVRVIDYMGTDDSIVQAARVSYGKGTKKLNEDRGLIRYLLRHRHTTPFEMCEIKLHVKVPIDCWRQWIRHRTANVNEYSTRYSVAIDEAQKTDPGQWRTQSPSNKQGSDGYLPHQDGTLLSEKEKNLQTFAREVYDERLEKGVAREQARKDLPLSTYTEAYWKIDLHNLLNFLSLRMDSHAQMEIRSYAKIIGENIVSRWCPLTWEAFQDYRVSSLSFSHPEQEIMKAIITNSPSDARNIAISRAFIKMEKGELIKSRECKEFESKLKALNIEIPWA